MQKKESLVLQPPTEEEVRELAARAALSNNKDFLIHHDINVLQNSIQTLVNQNNQEAEKALLQKVDADSLLVNFATLEQNIADKYKYLLLQYEGVVETYIDQGCYKLVLYFDNYFVDFENNIKDAKKHLYTKVHHHPYFIKIYRTTQDKISTIYKIYLDNIAGLKKNYITDRQALIALQEEKKHYMVEFYLLMDEFETYSGAFLDELQAKAEDYEIFEKQKATLQERYSL